MSGKPQYMQEFIEPNHYPEPYNPYPGHYNNFTSSMVEDGGSSPARCYPNASVSQYQHADTSPMKQFHTAGGAYISNATTALPQQQQASTYANAASKPTKFDPFGYQSRSPQQHQNFQRPSSRPPFFEDPHHHVRAPMPGLTGPPVGYSPTRPQHQQQQRAPFIPPAAAFQPQHHHQFQATGNRHPPPPPFFPHQGTTPTVGGVVPPQQQTGSAMPDFQQHTTATAAMNGNNNANFGGEVPSFIFDGQPNNNNNNNGHMATMNGVGGNEFGDEFNNGAAGGIQYELSNLLLEKIQSSHNRKALFELQIGLEQIAFDTSNFFETWASVIKDRMVGAELLPEADLNIAAAILVEMAVVLDESQYNYSRLGQYLCRTIAKFGDNFLLPQVSAFITETNTFLSARHLSNLVLFLAELYDKIDLNGVKSSLLAAHLFDQLRNLLKLTSPINDLTVGVLVKVLKLVGRFLENDRGPQSMAEFLSDFEQVVQEASQLSDSSKEKLRSLVKLRENKWGVVAEPTITGNGPILSMPSTGLTIGPDGEQLTEDECAFMEESLDTFERATAFEEDNVEDDYEKFLQATAIRAAEKALEKASIDEDDDVSSALSSPKFSTSK